MTVIIQIRIIALLMILWLLDSVEKYKYKMYKINNKTHALKREPSNKDKMMASKNKHMLCNTWFIV